MTRQLQRVLHTTSNPRPDFGMGPQRQQLAPVVHAGIAPITSLSCGVVHLAGGHYALPHLHVTAEISVYVVSGMAVTLAGPELELTFLHAPGSIMSIGAGVPHIGANLDVTGKAEAVEFRTDRHFNQDVELLPGLDGIAADRVARLQRDFALGKFAGQLKEPVTSTVFWAGDDN
ncbi:hypothetical protein [Amycolatopsis minnesotensis]|uniref:Cupin domain-containing protein n=1 Tax=Amycolatopsis minnesotensis TaxID=337894 RepID=A0ABN2R659_9PSEU